ncbi:hypothetical protein F4781DRAFT_440046 [Annulohypoxylon bovei var. microspora]|nr:hypothetical protein F4781DRAFT_440046 [Annulohypoxylon bovei var. microspora]
MCFSVKFIYRCGCVESTTFECPYGIIADLYSCRHCSGPGEVMTTALDEECFDCSEGAPAPSTFPAAILQERDPNLPTKCAPPPIVAARPDVPQMPELPFDF